MKVTVLHLDLGIGGAERLVVNTCCALQELGHDFTVLTSHHDKNHCFEETKPGGRLHPHIRVYGDWLPRHFLGRGTALFSVLRMIYLALVVVLIHLWQRPKKHVVFIDGVSAPIPILKLVGIKVLFYCHFPDKLLVKDYGGPIKRSYRFVLDAIEENTTGCADVVAVNSTFTAEEFRRAFRLLLLYNCGTEIMNPTVERAIMVDDYLERKQTKSRQLIEYTEGTDFVFVSINRFEREKHIELAIGALRFLKDRVAVNYKSRKVTVKLVVAGGYDPQVQENREYLEELRHVARKLEVEDDVVFRTSIGQGKLVNPWVFTPASAGRNYFA
jgi:alpha-1,3/alpha-1,6-mannosyltransferase